MEKIRLNNGEKVIGSGLSVFDQKGKPIAELTEGWTVVYDTDNEPVAQFVQDSPGSLGGTITTEHDDIGVAHITGKITKPDGTLMLDADGNVPSIEVTVVNSAPNTASFTPGTVEPE